MAKKETEEVKKKAPEETPQEAVEETPKEQAPEEPELPQADPWEEKYNAERDAHLRIAAEYDNFRKRTVKEKDAAYGNGKADAVAKILPVYDNLERALNQGTEDEAFLKGVEMTMTQLLDVLASLDIKPIEAVGQPFDPNLHNAVMHIEDEKYGENTVAACFQTGFMMGEKVIRFAMVQVAN